MGHDSVLLKKWVLALKHLGRTDIGNTTERTDEDQNNSQMMFSVKNSVGKYGQDSHYRPGMSSS